MDWSKFTEILFKLGSLAGLASLFGGAFLYFENRALKRLDHVKELEIAKADLLEVTRKRDEEEIEARTGPMRLSSLYHNPAFEVNKVREKYGPEVLKINAKIEYHDTLKKWNFLSLIKTLFKKP